MSQLSGQRGTSANSPINRLALCPTIGQLTETGKLAHSLPGPITVGTTGVPGSQVGDVPAIQAQSLVQHVDDLDRGPMTYQSGDQL
jgi:hypothetical protein